MLVCVHFALENVLHLFTICGSMLLMSILISLQYYEIVSERIE